MRNRKENKELIECQYDLLESLKNLKIYKMQI